MEWQGGYIMHAGPAASAGKTPMLGVEIGGGMAADYNHRVHLSSPDMPSMHLCDAANGFAMMGYYMYHVTSQAIQKSMIALFLF